MAVVFGLEVHGDVRVMVDCSCGGVVEIPADTFYGKSQLFSTECEDCGAAWSVIMTLDVVGSRVRPRSCRDTAPIGDKLLGNKL